MGEVYRARDPRLSRDVAIKVLPHDRSADPDAVARFEREARAVAALSHPNLLAVFDVGREADITYIVAELLKGESLRARLTRGPLPWRKAAELGASIASGLAAAHEHGVIHRDIKPENLFLTSAGHIKILDFGLARLRTSPEEMETLSAGAGTDPGTVLGTVGYMSPEQVRGESIDARSDLFSLGCVLYEMVTGSRPFQRGTAVETMAAILNEEPREPEESAKRLPPELNLIVRHCLEKRPVDRFQTALDLAFALRSAISGTSSGAAELVVPARKSYGIALVVALSVLVVVAIATVWITLWRAPAAPRSSAKIQVTRLTNTGRASDPAISPDGRLVAYIDRVGTTSTLRIHQIATGSDVPLVEPSQSEYYAPRFSRDGSYVYYLAVDPAGVTASVFRVPTVGGVPREVIKNALEPPAFSPDGQWVAFVRGDVTQLKSDVLVARSDGSGERVLASLGHLAHSPFAWSPDGSELLVAESSANRAQLTILSVADARSRSIPQESWYVSHPSWLSPDTLLALAVRHRNDRSQLWSIHPESGAARQLTNDVNGYDSLSVSEGGDVLAADVLDAEGEIWIGRSDSTSWRRIERDATRADGIGGLAFLADGRLLYTTRHQDTRQIWVMSVDGSGRRPFGPSGYSRGPAVSPDGQSVAYLAYNQAGRMSLWRMDSSGAGARQLADLDFAFGPGWSPDGRWIVLLGQKGTDIGVFRMPADGGEPVLIGRTLFGAPVISPNGQWLASQASGENNRVAISLTPFPDGGSGRIVPTPFPLASGAMTWAGDSALLVSDRQGNLMRVPVDGGKPTTVASLGGDYITQCASSRDGRIACVRSQQTTDVVLLRGLRAVLAPGR